MLKKLAFILILPIVLAAFIPCAAAPTPIVPRVYRTEMAASVAYHNGEKYIALDVSITDITEPMGLLGIEFNVLFDGDKLDPLWKTDAELNGNGVTYNPQTPPQMVTSWPTYPFSFMGNSFDIFAVEGLCKAYEKTGKGVLNVNLITNIDVYEFSSFADGELAIRLYFTPIGGFKAGEVYSFAIDGQYDEPVKQFVTTAGVSNTKPMPGVAYGYGDTASYTATWADCGAFDLAQTEADIVADGTKGILWVDGKYTANALKSCFKGSVQILNAQGAAVSNNDMVGMGYKAKTSEGTLTVAMRGDVNCDGFVSSLDYAVLKSALVGETELSELQSRIADISGEGMVTTTDAAWFKRLF